MIEGNGIKADLRTFLLLTATTAFIGALVGLERAVLPLLAEDAFGVTSATLTLSFIAAFGAAKAMANFFAGWLSDRVGRKKLLVAGWLTGLPVPFAIALAPTWGWVVAGNIILGLQQGLTWTMTLVMMSDLAGPRRRGFAMGVNEFTGYVAMGLAAWAAANVGVLVGPRPALLWLALGAAAGGTLLSVLVRDTLTPVQRPQTVQSVEAWRMAPPRLLVPVRRPGLTACYQAGLVTKVNDAGIWGLLPLLLSARGFSVADIALVAGVYPLVWGFGQALTGGLSDVADRRPLIVAGMFAQAVGLALVLPARSVAVALVAASVLGVGAALAYPTLLASVRDLEHGRWEASALGAYRFWRDLGFVVGALGIGAIADVVGFRAAVAAAVVVSALSGLLALRALPPNLAALARARILPAQKAA